MASPSIVENSIPVASNPLREHNFRMYWIGAAISLMGDQFYLVALPWVVLQMTGSAIAVGTVMMAASIPRALLMLLGGALTDRISARKIYMGTAAARTFFVAAIGVLLWMNKLRIGELYALGFAFGVADAFSMPAASTFFPSLVKREQMVSATSIFQTTAQLTSIAAPTPAALVIKALGYAWAFFIDAFSFLFVIAALWRLPDPPLPQTAAKKPPVWKSIHEGFAYVYRDVPLRSLMLLAAMINLCVTGPMSVGLPYLAKTKFGSPTMYAVLVSCMAAGGLLGALGAGVWKVKRRGFFLFSSCTVLGVCLGSIGILNRAWLVAGVLLLMATSVSISNVHITAWIQQRIDPAVRGRVISVLMLSGFGIMPISMAAAGFLVAWNLQWMFLLASAALLLVTAFGVLHKQVREIE